MSEKDNGGQAFPTPSGNLGMNLRDWFAGMALPWAVETNSEAAVLMNALNTNPMDASDEEQGALRRAMMENAASAAYAMADAMLAARKAGER